MARPMLGGACKVSRVVNPRLGLPLDISRPCKKYLGEALWFSQVALPTLGWVEIFCILPKNHWDGRVIFRMAEKIVGNGGRESSSIIPNVGWATRETQIAIPNIGNGVRDFTEL